MRRQWEAHVNIDGDVELSCTTDEAEPTVKIVNFANWDEVNAVANLLHQFTTPCDVSGVTSAQILYDDGLRATDGN